MDTVSKVPLIYNGPGTTAFVKVTSSEPVVSATTVANGTADTLPGSCSLDSVNVPKFVLKESKVGIMSSTSVTVVTPCVYDRLLIDVWEVDDKVA